MPQEGFAAKVMANNYGRPVIGSAEDVERLGRREVDSFFKKYYGPQSLTVTIVGDVDPAQVQFHAPMDLAHVHSKPECLAAAAVGYVAAL